MWYFVRYDKLILFGAGDELAVYLFRQGSLQEEERHRRRDGMKGNYSEKSYINYNAMMGHTIIDTVLLLAYAVELLKGSRTPTYFIVFALLCVVPVAAEQILYKRNSGHAMIKHIIGISYAVLYLFALFTTNSLMTFTYAFPMFMVIILYMDVRFCIMESIGACIGNAIYVIYYMMTVGYSAEEIPDVEIRIAAIVLTSFFMIMTTRAVKRVNAEKMKVIQEQTEEAGRQAENVLSASGKMISGIEEVSGKVLRLGESMEQIHNSMGEVSSGSTETAESVQLQLQKTEQIHQHIIRVKDTAAGIEENMNDTVQKVETGKRQMDALAEQVTRSMEANQQVLDRMQALSEYTSQMNTIIETITSITNSTGMLALNASIEAARAGETGRGFAVVASQISGLASQTKSATVNITELIEHINRELVSVEAAVDVVTASNKSNAESTQTVTENFEGITRGTEDIGKQTAELVNIVEELEAANADIVESIQTISAITEEVSAHAGETYNACEGNAALLESVTRVVDDLSGEAQRLRSAG